MHRNPVITRAVLYTLCLFLSINGTAFAKITKNQKIGFSIKHRTTKRGRKKYSEIYDHKLHRSRLVRDEVIIKFKENTSDEQIEKYLNAHNLSLKNFINKRTAICKGQQKRKFLSYLRTAHQEIQEDDFNPVELMDINEIKKVTVKRLRRKNRGPFRAFAKQQWHLRNDGKNGLTAGSDISVEGAWQFTKGQGVKVAVVDTGFDTEHPDINYSQVGFNALGSTDGSTSSVARSLSSASAPMESEENHGTAVAGIIGAKDNNKGVVGVAPEAEIIPIRMINDEGDVTLAQIASAFYEGLRLGARVFNGSWGTFKHLKAGEILELSELEQDLYKDVGQKALLVFSSGNAGLHHFNASPEARNPYTLAVGATDSTDQKARYSVFGRQLDLVAPGGGFRPVFTTDRRDQKMKRKKKKRVRGYSRGKIAKSFRGTSASAPVVSGVAALVWSINPDLSVQEVRDILCISADKIRPTLYSYDQIEDQGDGLKQNSVGLKSLRTGYGRVNATRAVQLARESLVL